MQGKTVTACKGSVVELRCFPASVNTAKAASCSGAGRGRGSHTLVQGGGRWRLLPECWSWVPPAPASLTLAAPRVPRFPPPSTGNGFRGGCKVAASSGVSERGGKSTFPSQQQQPASWLGNPTLRQREGYPCTLQPSPDTQVQRPSATTAARRPETGFPRGSGSVSAGQPAKRFASYSPTDLHAGFKPDC